MQKKAKARKQRPARIPKKCKPRNRGRPKRKTTCKNAKFTYAAQTIHNLKNLAVFCSICICFAFFGWVWLLFAFCRASAAAAEENAKKCNAKFKQGSNHKKKCKQQMQKTCATQKIQTANAKHATHKKC